MARAVVANLFKEYFSILFLYLPNDMTEGFPDYLYINLLTFRDGDTLVIVVPVPPMLIHKETHQG